MNALGTSLSREEPEGFAATATFENHQQGSFCSICQTDRRPLARLCEHSSHRTFWLCLRLRLCDVPVPLVSVLVWHSRHHRGVQDVSRSEPMKRCKRTMNVSANPGSVSRCRISL